MTVNQIPAENGNLNLYEARTAPGVPAMTSLFLNALSDFLFRSDNDVRFGVWNFGFNDDATIVSFCAYPTFKGGVGVKVRVCETPLKPGTFTVEVTKTVKGTKANGYQPRVDELAFEVGLLTSEIVAVVNKVVK